MLRSVSPSGRRVLVVCRTANVISLLFLWIMLSPGTSWAYPEKNEDSQDQQTVKMLLQRIEQLETDQKALKERVAQLETAQKPSSTANAAAQPAPAPATPHLGEPTETPEPEKMDVSKTLLNIRGFGDFGLYGGNRKGQTTSFSLGELNLFVTSNISDRFKFLSEIVFEANSGESPSTQIPINAFKAEPERVLLEYSLNDYFNLAAGRYHTAIGYYNTAYHHSTWLQTTTGRPFLFEFEDDGGILPVHTVGVSASGEIPSGSLGLHYVAEAGNGRASRSPLSEPVQNVADEGNRKAVNLALFARPDAIPGLQVGVSGYRDVLYPQLSPKVGETIVDGYAVLVRSDFEWLNEGLVIRHALRGAPHVFDTPGFYSQISERFGSYRPYFRYQYVNAPSNEPIFPDVGLRSGPSVGVRYDANESVALKLQYDYTALRRQPGVSTLGLQVGFTF
jgi:hypothetical protein